MGQLAKWSCWRERAIEVIVCGAFWSWRQWRVHKRTIARLRLRALGVTFRIRPKQRVTQPLAYHYLHWLMRKAVHVQP